MALSSLSYVLPTGVEAHACNPRSQEVDITGPWVWGQPKLNMETLVFPKNCECLKHFFVSFMLLPINCTNWSISSVLETDQKMNEQGKHRAHKHISKHTCKQARMHTSKHANKQACTHACPSISVRHICYQSTQEKKAGGQSSEFEASLGYIVRCYLKK